MAGLYYREDLSDSAFVAGATVEIGGDEARHAVRVARLRLGEQIMVGNAAGAIGSGEVIAVDRDSFAVRLREARVDAQADRPLILVQALAKTDRDERAVEQATEFGVDLIVPWQAERSVSRWDGAGSGDKSAKGVAKWQRIAREASKQALRARVPAVLDPFTLEGLCDRARAGAHVIVLHPTGAQALSAVANERIAPSFAGAPFAGAPFAGVPLAGAPLPDDLSAGDLAAGVFVVIGPEGGLSPAELAAFEESGSTIAKLGPTVLRTSSAGPAALAVLNVALGRW